MSKIRIQCSECGHEARVPEQFRSKKVRCLRCHAKLRIPEDAPVVETRAQKRAPAGRPEPGPSRPAARGDAEATRGGPSSKIRREAMGVLRELLHEYDHAIESVPRGFEVDLRGVAFGLARTLVEEMLLCTAIRDVKLAGGTGECRIVVTLQGHQWSPEDSFAGDEDDTEVFQRPGGKAAARPRGLIDSAVAQDEGTDPAHHLQQGLGLKGAESATQGFFAAGGRGDGDPVALFEEARGLIEDGEPEAAIELLERAVKADMRFAEAVKALGNAYASIGDYQRARRAFRHLTKLDPDDPEKQVLHAASAVKSERWDEAREALSKAIALDPEYTQAYRYAAQLYEKIGDEEKARKFRARYQALKLRSS